MARQQSSIATDALRRFATIDIMKAIDRPFTNIINGTSQFVIPVFQRDYSWSESQCEQLWNDILSIAGDGSDRVHFLGSVVYVSAGDSSAGFTRWLLVDGQQRVTTLTLLLAALRDHIRESQWVGTTDGPTAKRVDAYFLRNIQEDGDRQYKLVLRRHDDSELRAIVDGEPAAAEWSRIRENYEYFRDRMTQSDPEAVYRGVARLTVVDVTLDRGADDPQLIFESLNSTGIDLSQSDLIRNFILMRQSEPEQTRLYNVYWSKLEALFRGSERTFDAFMRDYIALQTRASKQERADAVYFAFRRMFPSLLASAGNLDELFRRLLTSARHHAAFTLGVEPPPQLSDGLARLRRIVDVPAILVMRLFECHERHGTMTRDEVRTAIELIESYIFRRAICGEQSRGYWQVFANLAYGLDVKTPLNSLKVGLARLHESYRFPDDSEFTRSLEERDLYHKRVCFDLLSRLENEGSKEPSDTSQYSIEHIMPQNDKLSPEWRQMLGEHWHETHRTWLHRLGNLTLTGYNSTYSDRPFLEKKSISGGFSDSSVRLNRYVREQPVWTEEQMRTRGADLAARAAGIWKPLVVDQHLIEQAERNEMRDRASRRDVAKVPMTAEVRQLFQELRDRVLSANGDIIELAEQKSVSYHAPTFFMEVLPRKNRLTVLLALEFSELREAHPLAEDASVYHFFVNAQYEGGVFASLRSLEDVNQVIPLIRQAQERARE